MSGRLLAWSTLVGLQIALAYGSRATGGKPPKDAVYHYDLAVGGLIQYGIVLAILLAIASPIARERFALRAPRSWRRALGWVLVVLVAIYAVGELFAAFLDPGGEQGLTPTGWEPDRAGAFAFNFVVIAGVAPLVEELTFRGLGYSLLERFGPVAAIAVVGLTFGLAHGLVEALPILAVFGAGLAVTT